MDWIAKVRIAAGCSILMGLTWVIGLFAVADLKFAVQVLFCVFNSLQGFFIFIFYCARNQDVRKEWLSCCGCSKDKAVSSDGKVSKDRNGKVSTGYVINSNTKSILPSADNVPLVKQSNKTVETPDENIHHHVVKPTSSSKYSKLEDETQVETSSAQNVDNLRDDIAGERICDMTRTDSETGKDNYGCDETEALDDKKGINQTDSLNLDVGLINDGNDAEENQGRINLGSDNVTEEQLLTSSPYPEESQNYLVTLSEHDSMLETPAELSSSGTDSKMEDTPKKLEDNSEGVMCDSPIHSSSELEQLNQGTEHSISQVDPNEEDLILTNLDSIDCTVNKISDVADINPVFHKSIERLYSTQSVAVEFGEEIEEPIDVENELSTILSVPFLPCIDSFDNKEIELENAATNEGPVETDSLRHAGNSSEPFNNTQETVEPFRENRVFAKLS